MRQIGQVTFWCAFAAGMFYALPVMAEDAEQSGLPQLDPSQFPQQLFWLAISFGVLYLLMSRVALPRVANAQDNRAKVIADEIEAARLANEQAKSAMAAIEKSMAAARNRAQVEVSDMLAKVSEESAHAQSEQERELMRRINKAEGDIAVVRESSLKSVPQQADELARAVLDKILSPRRAA